MTVPIEPANADAAPAPAVSYNPALVQDDGTIVLRDDYIESLKQHLPHASESRTHTRSFLMHEIVPKILKTINKQMENAKYQGLYLFEYLWPPERGHARELVFEIIRRMGYTIEFVRERKDGEGAYWRISWADNKNSA
jgi:hypothetical protein